MNKSLVVIILLSSILRFYKLESYPVSLYWDEAAIGYNAYSIARTGKDEYGQRFPVLFKSFNDYKLPGYIYLDALFLKVFTLSEFSVRFPSAISGVSTVVLIYFLTRKLLNNDRIALTAAFLLAISPWHLQFSRAAFEANVALFISVLGTTLFVFGFRNKFFSFLSIPILFTSFYFYHSPRIFIPAITLITAILYRKDILKNFRFYFLGLFTGLIILTPILMTVLSPQGLKRINEVSIFSDQSIIETYVTAKKETNLPFSNLFLNQKVPILFEAAHNYFAHLSPGFLFFGDDPNPRHKSAFHGNLYLFELPFLFLGFWYLAKQKDKKANLFILSWLLIAPLPASFAKESPHGLRALLMLPPIVILSGIGLVQALKFKYMKFFIPALVLLSIVNYLFTYYLIYPLKENTSWAFGNKQAIKKVSMLQNQYDRIIFTGHYWKPYIFYLFYNQISPEFYYSNWNQENIGKYKFGIAAWDTGGSNLSLETIEKLKSGKTLLVISPTELEGLKNSSNFRAIENIYDYSGKTKLFSIGEWQ